MRRITPLFLFAAQLLTACSGSANPTVVSAERLPVEIGSVDLLQLESYPVQLMLHVEGWLPNPCSTVGWDVEAGSPGELRVDLYAIADGSKACIQVLAPFEVNIPLGTAPEGDDRIFLNGSPLPLKGEGAGPAEAVTGRGSVRGRAWFSRA